MHVTFVISVIVTPGILKGTNGRILVRSPTDVAIVIGVLLIQGFCWDTRELIQGWNLTSVTSVASVLVIQEVSKDMKEHIQERGLINVTSVANVTVQNTFCKCIKDQSTLRWLLLHRLSRVNHVSIDHLMWKLLLLNNFYLNEGYSMQLRIFGHYLIGGIK